MSAVSAQSLDEAYRVELSNLQAEKKAMTKALREAKSGGARARAAVVSEIESLAATLTRLRADNAQNEIRLPQAERMHSMQEQQRSIERRQIQIETWLETHGVSLHHNHVGHSDGESGRHAPLDEMFETALHHVEEHGQLWIQSKQEYFRADGIAVKGRVLRIAEVGAVAIDDGFQPLDLGPDGSLRVADYFSPEPLSHGDSRSVGVVLFDPDEIGSFQRPKQGWLGWMERGGFLMWAIAALAALAFLLCLERALALVRYYLRALMAERRGLQCTIRKDDAFLRAVSIVQRGEGTAEELESQAAEAIFQLQPVMRRGVSLLAVIAAVAPLVGLLGTVTGMIGTFAVITEHGTGDPRLLSGGISEALLTTQFGLMVAIPALLMQTALYRTGDNILRRVENLALAALHYRMGEIKNDDVRTRGV